MVRRSARIRPLSLAVLLWSLLAAADGFAAGSAGEPEETRFSWHPSVEASVIADSNVNLEDSGTQSDVGAALFPRVELGLQSRSFHAGADLGFDMRGYTKDDSPHEIFVRFATFAELGLLPGLSARVTEAYVPTPIELGKPPDHVSNLAQTNRVALSLRHWSEMPKDREISLALTVARHTSDPFETDLGDGVIGEFRADFWEYIANGEFHTPVTEQMSGFLRAHARWRSFDDSEASDFADLSVLVGLSTQWWESLDFDFAIGLGRLAFEDHGRTRFIGEANARYRVSDGTTLRLELYQRNTADIVGNAFAESTARFNVERRFGERWAASAGFFVTRANNDDWSGSNFFGGVETTLRHQLSRRAQIELMYRHWENGGSYSRDDFGQNYLTLGVTYRR